MSTMSTKLYTALAKAIGCRARCQTSNNQEWFARHSDAINTLMESAPSGSGIDNGTKLDLDASTGEKLVFDVAYHHMNEDGYYDGWTQHRVIVTPSFELGYHLRITGPDCNRIKESLADVYHGWIISDVDEWTGYENKVQATA